MPNNSRLWKVAHEAMRARGLLPDFSHDVIAEVNALRNAAGDPAARDMRDLLWASIDNDDSRDLDQLSVAAAPRVEGEDTVYIAIADVDALVKKGSDVDAHAATNTTSVYTAAEIFPMLPERLSTDLTSLNPGVDRLAVVIEMTVDGGGTVTRSSIYRATVRNHAKLAYNGIAAWLDGEAPPPPAVAGLEEQVRRQRQVAERLKRTREARGALDLDTLEARPILRDRTLADLAPDPSNHAKELIEDFMVAANGVVARFLKGKGYAFVRRVLRTPERWDRIVLLARELGDRLPSQPDAVALDEFLRKRRAAAPDTFPDLSLAVVKLLGSGEYALDGPGGTGHFALAVEEYTHSTAPNRRYPDLITQRVLKAALTAQPSPYTNEELAALATHCTVQQKNAAKVERQVAKSAAAQILSSRIGATFRGIVTGASDKGTWVRIAHPTTEGRVVRGADGLDVGDRVTVKLLRTDIDRGFIDFAAAR